MESPIAGGFKKVTEFSSLLLVMCLLGGAQASEEIEIIDNSPFEEVEDAVSVRLVSIRPLTTVGFAQASELMNIRFSKPLIVESAQQFPEIVGLIEEAGLRPEDITLAELKAILLKSGYANEYLYQPDEIPSERSINPRLAISGLATRPSFKIWDATTITNMLATGVLDIDNVSVVPTESGAVEAIGFDGLYNERIAEVYKSPSEKRLSGNSVL